jgi:hypothetical protein
MGVNVKREGDFLYLHVSKGKLVNKQKEISADSYTGRLSKVERFEDEYEGQKVFKIKLTMIDGAETAIITFTEDSWFALGFFTRLNTLLANTDLDLEKNITVGVMPSEQNEKMSFAWMKHGDTKIGKTENFPMPKKVKIGGRGNSGGTEVTDWSDCYPVYDDIMNRANAVTWTGSGVTPEAETKTGAAENNSTGATPPADDDLPF